LLRQLRLLRCVRWTETTLLSVAVLTSSGHVTAYHGGAFYAVCSDNWSSHWSAGTCRDVAASSVLSVSAVPLSRSLYLTVVNGSVYDVSQLRLTASCVSGAVVRLVCRDAGCGLPSSARPSVQPFIVGGDIAPDGAWPWAATLLYAGRYQCSASLVASDWLITAAHCFFAYGSTPRPLSNVPQYFAVRLGSTQSAGYSRHLRVASVRRIVLHPDYYMDKDPSNNNNRYPYNDVALVQLGDDLLTPTTTTSSGGGGGVSSVCLVDNELHPLSTLKTWQCYAVGWGLTNVDGRRESVA